MYIRFSKQNAVTIYKIRVVAAFAKFHHSIHQVWQIRVCAALCQKSEIPLQNSAVVFLLNIRQLDFNDRFLFRRKCFLHVFFQSTKHHWLQQLQQQTVIYVI